MFNTQKDLMKHRKSEHVKVIKKCKNYDACIFKKECWYTHEDIDGHQQENNDKNENIIQKLFEVVEKFTEKVTRLEKISSQNIQWKWNIENESMKMNQWKLINEN